MSDFYQKVKGLMESGEWLETYWIDRDRAYQALIEEPRTAEIDGKEMGE